MVLPLLKLGTLALKTLSKPIASRLKQQAKLHPRFRQLIIDIAQANHRIKTNIQRRIYGHATDVEIRPLNEEKAVQASVDLIGDCLSLRYNQIALQLISELKSSSHCRTVAGAVVIFEVQRSAKSEANKEERRRHEIEALRQRDNDLASELELLRHKLEEIEQLAKGRGLSDIFHFKQGSYEDAKSAKPAS